MTRAVLAAAAASGCLVAAGCGGGTERKPARPASPSPGVVAELKTARGMSVRISARRVKGRICTDQRVRVPADGGFSEVSNRFCNKPGEPGTAVKATIFGRPAGEDGETIVYDSPDRCRLWRDLDARVSCTRGDPPVRLTLITGRRPMTLDDGETRLELPAFRCTAKRSACVRDVK